MLVKNYHNPEVALKTNEGILVESPTLNKIKEAVKMQKPMRFLVKI
jgi:hypothetical protein